MIIFILAGIIYYTSEAQSSAEINMGSTRIAVEAALRHYFDDQEKWRIYTFDRVFYLYNDKSIGFFTFNSFSYYTKSGIGLSLNLIGDINKFHTSMGLTYEKKIHHLYLYFFTTYSLNSTGLNEDYFMLVYDRPFIKITKLIFKNEFYASFVKWTYDNSYHRIKLGIEFKQTQIGFFNETSQKSVKNTLAINLGCYLKQGF